ncbi:MAG: TIGR00725 family protein [Actinobacteria bacterium]|nr:TIGR00725 family protein [Actinomycetota bacterium]
MPTFHKILRANRKIIKISVIGGSSCDQNIYEVAYQVGRNIAINNAILICGGMGGVMEAACKGAKDEGGITIGILPSEDEDTANQYVDIKIPTGLGYTRNTLVVKAGHAVIAINGGFGTLSEIGFALIYNKPLIGLYTWELNSCSNEYIPDIVRASSPEEAVNIAIAKAREKLLIS